MAGAQVLPGVVGTLAPLLTQYGYLAVAGLVLVESFGIPAPGEAVLIAGAVYAGAGRLDIVAVIVTSVLAAVIGDSVGYAIGRFGGRRLVVRYGRYVLLTSPRLEASERLFSRHGGKIVVVARFFEGLRQLNGIIAGICGMSWRRFVAFNALGAALWVGLWAGLGYLAGTHVAVLYAQIHHYQRYALPTGGALVLALIAWHLLGRHRTREGTAG